MKLILSLLTFIILANNCSAQLKKFETAVAYNDYIITEQVKIGKVIQEFNNAITATADTNAIHKIRVAIKDQADSSVKAVKLMQPYKGDTILKRASINLFVFYSKIAGNEYARLIRLFYNSKLSNEEMQKQLGVILKAVTEEEAALDKNFSDAQKAFALKHGFTLTENDFKIKN